jgi:hypothetical protein
VSTKFFLQGDVVEVLSLAHLHVKFQGQQGTVIRWCLDDLYAVKLYDPSHEEHVTCVLKTAELALVERS